MALTQYRPTRFNILPDVVKNIIIINVIMYLATTLLARQGIDLTDILGLHYFQSEKFRAYQFITYMFMHGSVAHIFFNMFAVWMFGSAVENIWGPKRFLTFYILTGLGAAVAHYAVVYFEMHPILTTLNDFLASPSHEKLADMISGGVFSKYSSAELREHFTQFVNQYNDIVNVDPTRALNLSTEYVSELRTDLLNAPVVVGASGALFGLLLAYGMMFPDTYIYLYFALPIKAKYFVIIYGLIELFSGIANVAGDNVAHYAHLGGLVSGWIIIMFWRQKDHSRRNDFFG